MRAMGKDYSNNLEILVHASETFYCQRPQRFFFVRKKKIWLINVSLITFRVQYVVGNMQAVITLDSFLCQSELLKQL